MTLRWTLLVLAAALCACSPSPPTAAQPPPGFPDLNAFRAVDPADYAVGAANFYSPGLVHCLLGWGREQTTICGGDIPGVPDSVPGTGCPYVRKMDASDSHDEPYVFMREQGTCTTAKSVRTMDVGRKYVGTNGTCVVDEGDVVACIDADLKHGFVLNPSGSWAF